MRQRLFSDHKTSGLGGRVQRYGLLVILIAFTGLGLLYDMTVPLFEKPDELKHFAVIQYIQTRGRLPIVEAGVYRPWDQEGTQPPLYHILAAMAVSWLDLSEFVEPPRNPHYADERSFVWRQRGNNNLYLHRPNEVWSIDPALVAARLARWVSLLAGLGTICCTYYLARVIFEPKASPIQNSESEFQRFTNYHWLPLLAAGLVAFIPQFLHVSTAITNDSLTATVAAITLLIMVLVVKNGNSRRYAVYLGISLGLGAITKLSLLYLMPLTGLVLLLDLARRRSVAHFLIHGAIVVGLIGLVSGWWYWRNWHLYGDVTALNAHLLYRGGALVPRPSLAQIWQTEIVGLELSFWAAFGAGQVLLEPWLYTILRGLKFVVGLGLLVGGWRLVRYQLLSGPHGRPVLESRITPGASATPSYGPSTTQMFTLGLLLLWTIIIFIALLRWMQITPASWGRLLFPTLPALGVLTAWSLSQFRFTRPSGVTSLSPAGLHVPRPTFYVLRDQVSSLFLPLLLLTFLFLLSVISPFRYLQAAYAKTPLISEADLPIDDIKRLDYFYGDEALHLIGYKVENSSVRPGAWLPVTLYWQATKPIRKNYSTFVHLLDGKGRAIGQANTYPDGGKWPTSMLEPGQVLKDTYYVFVPRQAEAEAPLVTRLAVGIFEFDDPRRAAKPAVNRAGQVVEPIVSGVPILPWQWPQPHPAYSLSADFGQHIRLTGYDWAADEHVAPGTQVPITFYWQALGAPGQNFNLFIHLVDRATQTQRAGFDAPPDFPTAFWQTGNMITDARTLSIPADLPPGEYELLIGWYDLDSLVRLETQTGDALNLLTVSVRP